MFSLIITIISIALVAALALATLYYGGASWLRGGAAADAATLANQGQQIRAAMELYYADHSAYPGALADLANDDGHGHGAYLKTIPVPPETVAALEPGLVEQALAASKFWTLLAAGQPAFMVHEAVALDVCREANYLVRGSDAIYEKVDPSASAQCFGPQGGPFTYVVGVPAGTDALASLRNGVSEYNAAHPSAPLAMVTDAAPDNPVTVAETRSRHATANAPGGGGSEPGGGGSEPAFSMNLFTASPEPVTFASTEVDVPVQAAVSLTNTNAQSVLVQAVTSSTPAVSASSDCDNVTLAANQMCQFVATLSSGSPLTLSGASLTVATDRGNKNVALDELVVTAPAVAHAQVSAGALAFDTLSPGSQTDLSVTLANIGNAPFALSGAPALAAGSSSAFSIAATTCMGSVPANGSCTVTVRFAPSTSGAVSGTLQLATSAPQGTLSVSLSGAGGQANANLTASTSADFGSVTVGSTTSRNFTLTNVGGAAASGVYLTLPDRADLAATANTCGTQAAPVSLAAGATCSVTLSWTPTAASKLDGASLGTQGSFTNQASIGLTGTAGSFNAAGAWSINRGSTSTPSAAFLDLGTHTPGLAQPSKSLYLRNTGSAGAMAVSFVLSGDTDQFEVSSVQKTADSTGNSSCGSTASGTTWSTCTTDARPGGSYPNIALTVRFAPTAVGDFALTITPVSSNGTALPGAITFTGKGANDPVAAWSSTSGSSTAFTSGTQSFGTRTVSSSTGKYVYVLNTGATGAMNLGLALSGDTTHFRIGWAKRITSTGTSDSAACTGTATTVSGCQMDAADKPGVAYKDLQLLVYYEPKAPGSHSVTFTLSSSNGTTLPVPSTLTLTGTAN
jgi:hypothetical protein